MADRPIYRNVLIKISGEVLSGDSSYGIDPAVLQRISEEIYEINRMGVKVGVVIGGGNIFRGSERERYGIEEVVADQMGMLATIINALALCEGISRLGADCIVMSPVGISGICEDYSARNAIEYLNKGKVLIFAGGTGSPFFSTDTAAALRAREIKAEVLLKGTKVEGVYDSDPEKISDPKMYGQIGFREVIEKELKVMDLTAVILAKAGNLPIIVFNIKEKGNLKKVVLGMEIGTTIRSEV